MAGLLSFEVESPLTGKANDCNLRGWNGPEGDQERARPHPEPAWMSISTDPNSAPAPPALHAIYRTLS